jgi:hypothetical protein
MYRENMKAIQVKSEEEFERLLEDRSIEASNAAYQWHLLKGLYAAINEHVRELNRTPAFWDVTFGALREGVLTSLGRLYDKTSAALSLQKFLLTVRSCSGYFSEHAFRRRLQHNSHVDSLAAETRTLDVVALQAEILSVSEKDPLVERLHGIRNKRIAHRDSEMVLFDTLSSLVGLTSTDIDALLDRANQITTKYSMLYRASCMSTRLHGADDYKDLLHLVKQSVEEEIRREKEWA